MNIFRVFISIEFRDWVRLLPIMVDDRLILDPQERMKSILKEANPQKINSSIPINRLVLFIVFLFFLFMSCFFIFVFSFFSYILHLNQFIIFIVFPKNFLKIFLNFVRLFKYIFLLCMTYWICSLIVFCERICRILSDIYLFYCLFLNCPNHYWWLRRRYIMVAHLNFGCGI